ncbi:hypothetical protein ACQY0O_005529 [Thecaphora frezii]
MSRLSILLLLPAILQLLPAVAALPHLASTGDGFVPRNSYDESLNTTGLNPGSASPSSSSASDDSTWPGFVNNNTIGTFPCSIGTFPSSPSQVSFSTLPGTTCPSAQPPVYPYNSIQLRSADDSIRATILPYGSVVSELWVKDRYGGWRDVVLGYDNKTNYGTDPIHPNFSPVVGRYANRIKNGTYEVDGKTYHAPLNENGVATLHGGKVGYDRSSYKIEEVKADEVVLSHLDPDGFQGFPGEVKSYTRYKLGKKATWDIELNATASQRTPLMLSSHVYWNLNAFNESKTVLDHVLHLPEADRYIKTDSILIPTGEVAKVEGTPMDFRQPVSFRTNFDKTLGVCGAGCRGWDSCFVMSHPPSAEEETPVVELTSKESGIRLTVEKTNQPAIQVYTCSGIHNRQKGGIPRKRSQGGDGTLNEVYENDGCVVIEMEDWIDGINHGEWGRDQVYGPGREYVWKARYRFSRVDEEGREL